MEDPLELDLEVPFKEDELIALERIGTVIRYPPDSLLMVEGEQEYFALLIREGNVKVVINKPRRIVGLRGPGEIVGEMAAIRRKPRSASIVALDYVVALHLPADRWLKFLSDHPRAALAQLYLAEERLAEVTRKTADSFLGAVQKLALAILELDSKDLGTKTEEGIALAFGQQDLADIAGVSLDSAKQAIRSFKARGIVRTGRQSTVVRDLEVLREIARGDLKASSL